MWKKWFNNNRKTTTNHIYFLHILKKLFIVFWQYTRRTYSFSCSISSITWYTQENPSASEDFVLHFISLLRTDSPSSSPMALDAIQQETFESIVWICLAVFIASLFRNFSSKTFCMGEIKIKKLCESRIPEFMYPL